MGSYGCSKIGVVMVVGGERAHCPQTFVTDCMNQELGVTKNPNKSRVIQGLRMLRDLYRITLCFDAIVSSILVAMAQLIFYFYFVN